MPHTLPPLSLNPDLRRRLESLGLAARRSVSLGGASQRAGAVRGGRVEFRDHRPYVEGDDIRDLDWNLYARTDELFLKTYGAQRRKHVSVWLDLSESMFLTPEKATYAATLGLGLGYIALAAGDPASLWHAGTGEETAVGSTVQALAGWQRQLSGWSSGAPIDWEGAVRRWTATPRPPGLILIVTDGWHDVPRTAFRPLYGSRFDVAWVQVRTPEEEDPPLGGNVRLEDVETGEEVSLTVGASDRGAYRRAVDTHDKAMRGWTAGMGMRWLSCRTDMPLEHALLTYLRQGGLLR